MKTFCDVFSLLMQVVLSNVFLNSVPGCQTHAGELCCVLSLDTSSIEQRTGFLTPSSSTGAVLNWTDDITL